MPRVQELKTEPAYFDAVLRGDKTFEVRKNDRDFQTGDTLILREWDPHVHNDLLPVPEGSPAWVGGLPVAPGSYTGRTVTVTATYVLQDVWEKFGIHRGFAVIGFSISEDISTPDGLVKTGAEAVPHAYFIREALTFCSDELDGFDGPEYSDDAEVCCQRANVYIRELIRRLKPYVTSRRA